MLLIYFTISLKMFSQNKSLVKKKSLKYNTHYNINVLISLFSCHVLMTVCEQLSAHNIKDRLHPTFKLLKTDVCFSDDFIAGTRSRFTNPFLQVFHWGLNLVDMGAIRSPIHLILPMQIRTCLLLPCFGEKGPCSFPFFTKIVI